jgi:hypothetical protein
VQLDALDHGPFCLKEDLVCGADQEIVGKTYLKDYFVPDFGVDKEILEAQEHIKQQEKTHGPWNVKQDDNGVWMVPGAADNHSYSYKSLLQLQSDPICDSTNPTCLSKEDTDGKKDYRVPNFGMDHDIVGTHESIKSTEKTMGKSWTPTQDENGNWDVPSAANNKSYRYAGASLAQVQSDPICSSAGCEAHARKQKGGDKIVQYPDPEVQGLEADIIHSHASEKQAQKTLGHVWKLDRDE